MTARGSLWWKLKGEKRKKVADEEGGAWIDRGRSLSENGDF
jgi:hypothetical protein